MRRSLKYYKCNCDNGDPAIPWCGVMYKYDPETKKVWSWTNITRTWVLDKASVHVLNLPFSTEITEQDAFLLML